MEGSMACVFCTAALTYNLTSLPRATRELHSGTPGDRGADPYITYLATSPCASVTSDLCFSGPTADPFALTGLPQSLGNPICKGLGSLDDAEVTAAPGGVSIALRTAAGNVYTTTVFNVTCDAAAPHDNPPEDAVVVTHDVHRRPVYTVTWRHPSACGAAPTQPGGCAAPAPPAPAPPVCEGCLPPWKPTWSMARSTALYGCNSTGPHNVDEAAAYGIMVYDWSHQKLQWASNRPMNTDALLVEQAERVLARDPGVPGEQPKVWLYRNRIKALPWIGQVREKLDDPAHAGWFVPFNASYQGRASNNSFHVPACDWYGDAASGPPKCSRFYHDQGQTPTKYGAGPAYSKPSRDGNNVCARGQCDCGESPCGEYTFDHRNASFADWWVNEYMISNQTLGHRPLINLGWLDDGISVNGMSEGAPKGTWALDTGSSPQDMQDHADVFRRNVGRLQRAVVARGGFYWQMIQGTGPNVRPVAGPETTCHQPKPRNVTAEKCAATLREWCAPRPEPWRVAHLYFVCPREMVDPELARDATAEFLLTRGEYAWIGYTWSGCFAMPGANATWLRPRPALWDADFGGAPAAPCAETAEGSGVFTRAYPRADVSWDCATGRGEIAWRG